MYDRWLRLQTMLLPWPDLPRVGPMALWVFRNIFLLNTSKDQKKVLSEHVAPGTVPYVIMLNPSLVIALRS